MFDLPVGNQMLSLSVHHRTSYSYSQAVTLGSHRLMLRPRKSRELRLISSALELSPDATVTWTHDVFGNAVATAVFHAITDNLVIDSVLELQLDTSDWPIFNIASSAIFYPFRHSSDEWIDLGALKSQQYSDGAGHLQKWARTFIRGSPMDTLTLLKDLSAGVSDVIGYESRDEEGTQPPMRTLSGGKGSCRDFAILFIEAARSLGFGARVVSGYLHNPGKKTIGTAGRGSTHAWAEVFLPGAGWITFDPTNRSVGGSNLIPIAVARDIAQTVPVAGSFMGACGAFRGMSVEVVVESQVKPTELPATSTDKHGALCYSQSRSQRCAGEAVCRD